jgi:hypothetical protein
VDNSGQRDAIEIVYCKFFAFNVRGSGGTAVMLCYAIGDEKEHSWCLVIVACTSCLSPQVKAR